MAKIDLSCDLCHTHTLEGVSIGIVWACPECKQKVDDSGLSPIPAGCIQRFYFLWYLHLTGRISEGVELCVK